MMRPYIAVINARLRALLQYRAAAAAGIVTQIFWGLIRSAIFAAFYHSTKGSQPMTLPEVITYVWLGQATLVLQPWNIDMDISQMIRSGNVAYELLRPVDLYSLWFIRSMAMRTAPTLVRAIPIFIISGLFFGLAAPASILSFAAWVLSIVGAILLSTALTTLFTVIQLWTISGDGIFRLSSMIIYVLSGLVIPLPLFPDWMQGFINFLPFRGIVDTPSRLYMGHIPPAGVCDVFLQQIVWTAVFVIVGRLLLARGMRRVVVQGG
jgi:ABC-2 type transport system permease protein